MVRRNYGRLIELLDLETGALDDMLSKKVISPLQYDEWSDCRAARWNVEFLRFVNGSGFHARKFETVLKILGECNQAHVVYFIRSGGGKSRIC